MDAEHLTQRADSADLPAVLRALRRRADLSQRELASRSGVPPATVAGVESGSSPNPHYRTVERLVAATGARLAVVDLDGSEPTRLATDGWRDQAGRGFPPHLDPQRITWRGTGPVNAVEFIRSRRRRDAIRRWRTGVDRPEDACGGPPYGVRRLGPGDTAVLAALRGNTWDLYPSPTTPGSLSDAEALRYLRSPSLRHWIVEERGILHDRNQGRVVGHLVAHVQHRHAGQPVMVVTEVAVRPEHRAGNVGIMLVAAMSDEAARLGAGEIVALPADRAAARLLHELGFRRRHRRPPLLALGW